MNNFIKFKMLLNESIPSASKKAFRYLVKSNSKFEYFCDEFEDFINREFNIEITSAPNIQILDDNSFISEGDDEKGKSVEIYCETEKYDKSEKEFLMKILINDKNKGTFTVNSHCVIDNYKK